MSAFLKFSFELISQILYNLSACFVGFFGGLFRLLITAWPEYILTFRSYFSDLPFIGKVLAILLCILLIAIPIVLGILIVRRIIIHHQLKANEADSEVLYKEIGRLNHQVLNLMDEKNKILALKVGSSIGISGAEGVVSTPTAVAPIPGLVDPLADPIAVAPAIINGGVAMTGASPTIGEDALSTAAAAAATAAAQARVKADEQERNLTTRFPKLSQVDSKYANYDPHVFDNEISLVDFVEKYRLFACSQMHLYYTPEIIRRFVAGMAASKILILEGISGTGKTSLPYSFSRFLDNPATIVPVQPSFRDRTELLGYFNEFSKRFNETEFLRALYEAEYREEPSFIVLDEMNLARIEYYFAEMLSVLEMPSTDEWELDLVPTAWPGDPIKMVSGKVHVSPNMWFVGTANSDDSTFTITDKVYDRAMPIELNERAEPFECPLESRCCVTTEHLQYLFEKAKTEHPVSESSMTKLVKLDQYLQTRFKLAFGNRIMKQLYDFIPVYVACGGTELGGMDYIIARKVLKKFESMNVTFVRDEIKGLISYMEKNFGKTAMPDSRAYLERIQNLY